MTEQDVHNFMRATQMQAQIACANAKIAGMQAENKQREVEGKSMAYTEEQFSQVILDEGIGCNDVQKTLWG